MSIFSTTTSKRNWRRWVYEQITAGAAGGVNVQDEGVPLASTGTTLNFVGAGVTASGAGATKTITIPGGGGGTPGGSDTQLQYNNAGAFGGVAEITYNGSVTTFNGAAASDFVFTDGLQIGSTFATTLIEGSSNQYIVSRSGVVNQSGIQLTDSGNTVRAWIQASSTAVDFFVGGSERMLRGVLNAETELYHNNIVTAETATAASGGLFANNTLTGGGLERVLTTSDLGTPATPGGANEAIQYNNGGSFGGVAGFNWDDINLNLDMLSTGTGRFLNIFGNTVTGSDYVVNIGSSNNSLTSGEILGIDYSGNGAGTTTLRIRNQSATANALLIQNTVGSTAFAVTSGGYIGNYPGTPADGEVLTWDAGNSRAEFQAATGGGIGGTISNDQIAVGAATADEIEGSTDLRFFAGTGTFRMEGTQPGFARVETGGALDEKVFTEDINGGVGFRRIQTDDFVTGAYTYEQVTRSGTGASIQVDEVRWDAEVEITVNIGGTQAGRWLSNVVQVGSETAASSYSVLRGINDGELFLSGGNSNSDGASIRLAGETQAGLANDMQFLASGNAWGFWDESSGAFQLSVGTGAKTQALLVNSTRFQVDVAELELNNVAPVLIINDSNNGTGGTSYRMEMDFNANDTTVGVIGYTEANNDLILQTNAFNSSGIRLRVAGTHDAFVITDTGATTVSVDGSGINELVVADSQVDLGNFAFDVDQTVGAGQDNFVLTYDNGSGLISLEAAPGGGSSVGGPINSIQYHDGGGVFGGVAEFTINDIATTTGFLGIQARSGLTSGDILNIYNNEAGKTGQMVRIRNDNASGDTIPLRIDQDFQQQHVIQLVRSANSDEDFIDCSLSGQGGINPQYEDGQVGMNGTAVDFSNLPQWITQVVITIFDMSTTGTSIPIIQVGNPTIQTTGYLGSAWSAGNSISSSLHTNGFRLSAAWAASNVYHGTIILTRHEGVNNQWNMKSQGSLSNTAFNYGSSGSIDIAGSFTLDSFRITTVGGTDTFDDGSAAIIVS